VPRSWITINIKNGSRNTINYEYRIWFIVGLHPMKLVY
jgi:hypothetical protein